MDEWRKNMDSANKNMDIANRNLNICIVMVGFAVLIQLGGLTYLFFS